MDDWWGRPVPEKLFRYFRNTSFVPEEDGRIVTFLIGLRRKLWKGAAILAFSRSQS